MLYITRRQSPLWCHRHSRQCHHRGPCSGGGGDTRAGTTSFSDRPGVRAPVKRNMESVYSGESWTIYIKSQHACWPYLPSYRKTNHFSLSDGFRPFSPSFGCCDCFNNLIVPCQFLFVGLGFYFLTYVCYQYRRYLLLAVGTGSTYSSI